MLNYLLPIAGGVFLGGLLWAEKVQTPTIALIFKALASSMFVLLAITGAHPAPWYYHLVLAGLILGLIGDVCLALPGQAIFRAGLLSFLAGHIVYIIAFAMLALPEGWISFPVYILAGLAVLVFLYLRPHLGKMLVPVLFYIVVITVMVAGAWAMFVNPAVGRRFAWVVLIGAVAFFISDLFVARDKFLKDEWLNRLLGLPVYYLAQFLIAFSVGMAAAE